MNVRTPVDSILPARDAAFMRSYLDALTLVERLHRLLLDVIKDEFERLGILDVNPVQALLLFNIGDNEVTAGELKTRGYYQGSNVSYNLKKLVDLGYMHHQRSEIDHRSVRAVGAEQFRRRPIDGRGCGRRTGRQRSTRGRSRSGTRLFDRAGHVDHPRADRRPPVVHPLGP